MRKVHGYSLSALVCFALLYDSGIQAESQSYDLHHIGDALTSVITGHVSHESVRVITSGKADYSRTGAVRELFSLTFYPEEHQSRDTDSNLIGTAADSYSPLDAENGSVEKQTVSISVRRPFWASWWAIAGYFILFNLIVYWGLYVRTAVLDRRGDRQYRTSRLIEINTQQQEEINRLKKIEKELKEQTAELKQLSTEKDKLFSIIFHDLKTPFNSLMGFSQMLVSEFDELSENEKKEMLQHMHNSSLKLHNLLETMLEWAKVQTGRMKYEPLILNINETADDVITLLKSAADEKNIQLTNKVNRTEQVKADPNMLHSIIQNLVSNAIKFTDTGGEVTIETKRRNDHLLISVSDNGRGMSPERIEKLFKPDSIQSTKGTRDEKGAGLGLKLCKEMTDLHGGTISVESEPGAGSVFTIALPDKRT